MTGGEYAKAEAYPDHTAGTVVRAAFLRAGLICAAADAGSHRPPPERFRDGSRTESLERGGQLGRAEFFRARGPLGRAPYSELRSPIIQDVGMR